MAHHFIAKITPDGGPPPREELARILDQADNCPDREAWFGTHKPGANWDRPGICVLLAVPTLQAVICEVIGRSDTMPDIPAVKELYYDHGGFSAWWHVRNPVCVQFDSLDSVPGHGCASGRGAAHVFKGQVSFAYWDFGNTSFDDLVGRAVVAKFNVPLSGRSVIAVPPAPKLSAVQSGAELWSRPEVPLYGVDFSGGEEDQRYGNRKIWIAKWFPGKEVTLRCGWCGDPADKICRNDLATLIKHELGWWSLDFPFGIAKKTAHALGLNGWPAWLEWCAKGGDATDCRDEARERTTHAGVVWAERRQIDKDNKTTWFPLFEQLYRQTIYGGREVLLPLQSHGVCVMPWGLKALRKSAIVVEGFPGATVTKRLLGRRPSYKGSTYAHRTERQNIINALMFRPFAIPIADEVVSTVVGDQDGDALDALVLLVGSWIAWRLPTKDWEHQLAMLEGNGATVEGWFPI
jgi:hypothetical protein